MSPLVTSRPIFTNRNLDPLRRETLTQIRALDYAREFLGAKHLKDLAIAGCQDGCRGGVEFVLGGGTADVDEIHLESEISISAKLERRG